MKTALITGISGQDGSYLAEYLVELGYRVCGMVRRDPRSIRSLDGVCERIEIVYGDMRDTQSIESAFRKSWPDEVYNLAGQTFVPASWELPAETFDINVGGLSRLLRTIEREKPDTRLYQASSSEMYGNVSGIRNESTPMMPTSPYGISKFAAHRLIGAYRARNLYAVSGILFNHESPRRGPEMVTRKITRAAAGWARGDRTKLKLGDLQARRDWGFAGDYVRAMHAMLQQDTARDYVIATGVSHSVEDFLAAVFEQIRSSIGISSLAEFLATFIEVDPRFIRAGEVRDLRVDVSAAQAILGWKPEVDFQSLVRMMVQADVAELERTSAAAAIQAAR